MKPLEGFTILDFSQFLAGPFASLRLADLGASVIKVEKPGTGDSYRSNFGPALKDVYKRQVRLRGKSQGDSTCKRQNSHKLFPKARHTRKKECFSADRNLSGRLSLPFGTFLAARENA